MTVRGLGLTCAALASLAMTFGMSVHAAALGSPGAGWNVEVQPANGQPGVLSVRFDSPSLGRRVQNTVYLPTSYRATGPASAVMYYLHGTVIPRLDDSTVDPITDEELLLRMVGTGGGNRQTELFDFASQRDRAHFLVVALDTDPGGSWCQTCLWIDGRRDPSSSPLALGARRVQAETHLYTETIPLVEQLFNVRHDRGGRGLIGFSMGGAGALIQGVRHPDRFAYVGSISGAFDFVDEPGVRAIAESVGYLRDQGYGSSVTDEGLWRLFNPADHARNLLHQDVELMLSSGDGCVSLQSSQAPDCTAHPAAANPLATSIELALMHNHDVAMGQLEADGVPATHVRMPGIHGTNNHRVYAEIVVPAANRVFEATAA